MKDRVGFKKVVVGDFDCRLDVGDEELIMQRRRKFMEGRSEELIIKSTTEVMEVPVRGISCPGTGVQSYQMT